MTQLNAATRLVADAMREIERDLQRGRYKVVEGQGQRWMAVQFPNGRYGVIDSQVTGTHNKIRATGLCEEQALHAVKSANAQQKFHPTMTMKD
jgi:hypothetical protein